MKKLYIKTFGCQMNEYDSEKMADVLHSTQGMDQTDEIDDADVILLNTCSIREKAQEKVFSDLGRLRELKQLKPDLLIGVGGCVASQEGKQIINRAPHVDFVFGPQTLHRLPKLIDQRLATGQSQVDISFPEIEKFDHLPRSRQTKGSAFVSIMEGCSKYCSYCVVPYTRGEEVSRPFEDVLTEIVGLTEQGVKEITLLGQNVNAYRGRMGQTSEIADFALLLEYMSEIPGLERIRFTTSHPKEFTQRLIDVYDRVPQLVSHLHLPVQHASDKILSAMKRGYTSLEFKSIIRKMRSVRPKLSLSSDFIVGFPGETEAEFEDLLAFIRAAQIDRAGCFAYSPVSGAAANDIPGMLAPEVREERRARFMAVAEAVSVDKLRQRVGARMQVLVDSAPGLGRKGAIARTYADAPEIDGVVRILPPEKASKTMRVGEFTSVHIVDTQGHDLVAQAI